MLTQIINGIIFLVKYTIAFWEGIFKFFLPAKECDVSTEIVLITGAAQGIGKELALQYGKLGAKVICVDLVASLNAATVAELRKEGIDAYAFTCDVSDRADVFRLAKEVDDKVGRVTILVNNAGICRENSILQTSEKDVRQTIDINIVSHFWTVQAFLPGMQVANKGHIVALSSTAGLCGQGFMAAYCASKFAVCGLMEALNDESRKEGRDIKFTTICPLYVKTDLLPVRILKGLDDDTIMSASTAAANIIKAQRQEKLIASIPSSAIYFSNIMRCFPARAAELWIEAVGLGSCPPKN